MTAITVADLQRTVFFYTQVLGMTCVREPGRPTALTFGSVAEVVRSGETLLSDAVKATASRCAVVRRPRGP